MFSWLAMLLRNILGQTVARGLVGAGLALVTTVLLIPLVTSALNLIVSKISGIPADVLNIALLMGFGEALSIIGSAMLTRLALQSLHVGIVKATT
ncbi:hypothetical protein B398_05615 [Xylella fastidiosa 32]|nr:DUF2523 domain-containing protein [Xylella fastidiosa]ETE32847.1 hypothetical protein B398_05615 [Xylella fastidiosa 32]